MPSAPGAGLALVLAIAAGFLPARAAAAQEAPAPDAAAPKEEEKPLPVEVYGSVYLYVVPDELVYLQPTVTVDHESGLHLEGRYNYEEMNTASFWAGWGFGGGGELEWEITPMLGGVYGDLKGFAAGFTGALRWKGLELYSQSEYVYDTEVHSDSYFYTWTELTASFVDWFRFGLVTQRTRAYETKLDIQRGFLLGFDFKKADLAFHVFNPEEDDPVFVASFGLTF